jgi:hypothetical protein
MLINNIKKNFYLSYHHQCCEFVEKRRKENLEVTFSPIKRHISTLFPHVRFINTSLLAFYPQGVHIVVYGKKLG